MDQNYYTNLCTNIRFTDDISFKLLGLVPLFSGSGMFVAVMRSEYFWSPVIYAIAAFGALITLGLFRWELRNIQTCLWLIDRGADCEIGDHIKPGQFYQRAKAPLRMGKTIAEKLIYGVTIFTWLLLPWLVYSTAKVKNNPAPAPDETLNTIYLAFAAVVGIFTLVSIVLPLKTLPAPPKAGPKIVARPAK